MNNKKYSECSQSNIQIHNSVLSFEDFSKKVKVNKNTKCHNIKNSIQSSFDHSNVLSQEKRSESKGYSNKRENFRTNPSNLESLNSNSTSFCNNETKSSEKDFRSKSALNLLAVKIFHNIHNKKDKSKEKWGKIDISPGISSKVTFSQLWKNLSNNIANASSNSIILSKRRNTCSKSKNNMHFFSNKQFYHNQNNEKGRDPKSLKTIDLSPKKKLKNYYNNNLEKFYNLKSKPSKYYLGLRQNNTMNITANTIENSNSKMRSTEYPVNHTTSHDSSFVGKVKNSKNSYSSSSSNLKSLECKKRDYYSNLNKKQNEAPKICFEEIQGSPLKIHFKDILPDIVLKKYPNKNRRQIFKVGSGSSKNSYSTRFSNSRSSKNFISVCKNPTKICRQS